MKIIDAHAHVFPPKIAAAAAAATESFYAGSDYFPDHLPETPAEGRGTADGLICAGARAGVETFLVFSTATAAHQVESVNSFIARTCADHPGFIGAGTMHVEYPDYETEVRRIKSLGLRGVKLHPDIQKFAVDDRRILPLYELLQAEGLFLVTHAGDYRFRFSSPGQIAHVAALFPGLRIIAAHFGGWSQWDEARSCLSLPNVFFDTSSTLDTGGVEAAKLAFRTFDNTHFFFGSDYPMWSPSDEWERMKALGLGDGLLEMVAHKNFEAFLNA